MAVPIYGGQREPTEASFMRTLDRALLVSSVAMASADDALEVHGSGRLWFQRNCKLFDLFELFELLIILIILIIYC